jgi:hypothetical protein
MQMITRTSVTLAVAVAVVAGGSLPDARAAELLVFDWNKAATQANHGFPWDSPPKASANGDWTKPADYASGTLHYRVEIKSQPVAQDMKLQFCFWQKTPSRENCGPLKAMKGTPGTVVTWSCDVTKMWKKDGNPVEWTLPRQRNGVAVKDASGKPVSDYSGWNWNGHDPAKWYPLDLRFTVVVVSKGSTFSGWSSYVGSTTPKPDSAPPADSSAPPPEDSSAPPPKDSGAPPEDSGVPAADSVSGQTPDAGAQGLADSAPEDDSGVVAGPASPDVGAPPSLDSAAAGAPQSSPSGRRSLNGGGCAVTGRGPGGLRGGLLALLLLALRRRRQR